MSRRSVLDCIVILCFVTYAFIPFDKKRVRARWAKLVFVISAAMGILRQGVKFAWDMGWFTLDSEASSRLNYYLYMVSGLLLGFIFSLIFSGQLLGTKRIPDSGPRPNPN